MTKIGDIERRTQNRIVRLFQDSLHYDYLGNWEDRYGNSNVELDILQKFLEKQKYSSLTVSNALPQLSRGLSHLTYQTAHAPFKPNKSGYRDWETDRKSTRLNSSHSAKSRMPSSA